jgi:recombinational DNA repair protein RecT
MSKLTYDAFPDEKKQELFESYRKDDLNTFQAKVADAIRNNTVSDKAKKESFIRSIMECRTKDRILQKITNIFLAGEGYGIAA